MGQRLLQNQLPCPRGGGICRKTTETEQTQPKRVVVGLWVLNPPCATVPATQASYLHINCLGKSRLRSHAPKFARPTILGLRSPGFDSDFVKRSRTGLNTHTLFGPSSVVPHTNEVGHRRTSEHSSLLPLKFLFCWPCLLHKFSTSARRLSSTRFFYGLINEKNPLLRDR